MYPIDFTIFVPVLTFVAVVSIGLGVVLVGRRRRLVLEERLRGPSTAEGALAAQGSFGQRGGVAAIARAFSAGTPSQSLRAQLARAGFHGPSAAAVYSGSKILLLIVGTMAFAAATTAARWNGVIHIVASIWFGAALSFIPNVVVAVYREKRRQEIRRCLPDAVDLLEICLSAGMGLDMAWNSVSEQIRRVSPLLADEMSLTDLELHLGATRTAALRHMAERTQVAELGSLVALLAQAERFGTSVSDALRTAASSLRDARSQRAEEAAEKMAVKLLIPMVLFIFPAVLIVVAGPAGLRLMEHMFGK